MLNETFLNFSDFFFLFRDVKTMKPLNFYEHLNGVKSLRNQVNIGRGSIPYINLEAADPSSQRPACLFVSSALNPCQVSKTTVFKNNSQMSHFTTLRAKRAMEIGIFLRQKNLKMQFLARKFK